MAWTVGQNSLVSTGTEVAGSTPLTLGRNFKIKKIVLSGIVAGDQVTLARGGVAFFDNTFVAAPLGNIFELDYGEGKHMRDFAITGNTGAVRVLLEIS